MIHGVEVGKIGKSPTLGKNARLEFFAGKPSPSIQILIPNNPFYKQKYFILWPFRYALSACTRRAVQITPKAHCLVLRSAHRRLNQLEASVPRFLLMLLAILRITGVP